MKSIEARFQWLAEHPLLGKQRTDICEGYQGFPEGQHVVFYLFSSSAIDIIGIPHKDMDTISYFLEGSHPVFSTRNIPLSAARASPNCIKLS